MLTAHYDHLGVQHGHLYPGANDNASGRVAVMELARLFANSRLRPRRSILFVVFGSEEQLMLARFITQQYGCSAAFIPGITSRPTRLIY